MITGTSQDEQDLAGIEAGFSLLEMLLALSLVALLATLLLAGFQSARIALERASSSDVALDVAVTQSLLRNLLSEIQPVKQANDPGAPDVFHGEANSVRFVSSYTAQSQISGLYESALFWKPTSTDRRRGRVMLSQRLRRFNSSDGLPQPVLETTTTLIEGVTGLRIKYYGQLNGSPGSAWFSSWSRSNRLPEKIEVEVMFALGDTRSWRSMIAHLALSE
jgi:general secretion pathway protein J